MEINEQVGKTRKKKQNKEPSELICENYFQNGTEGLIRIIPVGVHITEETRGIQESHNANHVLYYISMLIYAIVHGVTKCGRSSNAGRICAHLTSLREFLNDSELELRDAVNALLRDLQDKTPDSLATWAVFLQENWEHVQSLSRKYSPTHQCFTDEAYCKLGDVAGARHHYRIWWWHTRTVRLLRRITSAARRRK